ncbi:MAG: 2,3-bisphosphoglycerate-independent phosphoglycerate mutase [Firmicutes bacterium]|nr:2,3-bisphosphoglycerate-independent phosphoglycerate mutase [Bacillota bacterium]
MEERDFFANKAFLDAVDFSSKNGGVLHLVGLVSPGGVHSSMDHLSALLELARKKGVKKLALHALLDGRDTPPRSALEFVEKVEKKMAELGLGFFATVGGRYYGMDRDKRWERVEKAYRAMVSGEGEKAASAREAVLQSYEKNKDDEFVLPTVINGNGERVLLKDGDSVIHFNFRPDRARQLTRALTVDDFNGFDRGKKLDIFMSTMTEYEEGLPVEVAYPAELLENTLGKVVSKAGLKQLRIAETEKYAHVTYFFSGGREEPFPGEDRVLIQSPKVATYDLQPEMSCYGVKDAVIERIKSGVYDLIVLNFANPDMVGHTGKIDATVKALEAVDSCLGEVISALQEQNMTALVISDHGNSEQELDHKTGQPHTAHTCNPVPFILVSKDKKELKKGILANIAPTILDLMGIPKPEEMTEVSLIVGEIAHPPL